MISVAVQPSFSQAAPPNLINYQGSLTDTGGIPVNGDFPMTFRIYDDPVSVAPANLLYAETQTVTVTGGIYSVLLGSATPTVGTFDSALFAGGNRWLEVEVGTEVLTPRQRITSVAWSLQAQDSVQALNADTVDGKHALDLLDKATYDSNADNKVDSAENSDTATTAATATNVTGVIAVTNGGTGATTGSAARANLAAAASGANSDITSLSGLTTSLSTAQGGTGADTSGATGGSLMIATGSGSWAPLGPGVSGQVLKTSGGAPTWGTDAVGSGTVTRINAGTGISASPSPVTYTGTVSIDTTVVPMLSGQNVFSPSTDVTGIVVRQTTVPSPVSSIFEVQNATGTSSFFVIDSLGNVIVKAITITGGADLAEPFDCNDADSLKAGMVVSIDPDHSGQLKIADESYDPKVAGIISGAGGIRPGVTMNQSGTAADGNLPVALTGRVYAWADASFGAIGPGDLLTTSENPGHVMKVTDRIRAQGAILGKAMTALKKGEGLVLVLVSLQ